ncbi:MAG: N-methyl-L-tryptophan oxidase [Chloroflexota bacterium]
MNTKTSFDTIVLGCGGIGSGALYWLARRLGNDVLGIEQFPLFHHNGGSQDHSRVIRLHYHRDDYAQLTPHTYAAWQTVAEEAGVQIVTKTGGLMMTEADAPTAPVVRRYAHSLTEANIPFEWLTADEIEHRFPQFTLSKEMVAFYQAKTGIVDAGRGNACHIALARSYGATVLAENPVQRICPVGNEVHVETAQGTFSCRHLIVAAGAWSNHILANVGVQFPLRVTQEQVTYYATPYLREFGIGRFPVWQWKTETRGIYGFPVYGEVATKAAIDESGIEVTANTRTFEPSLEREQELEAFISRYIPRSLGPKLYTKTCLYTVPPDRDFILGPLPQQPNITVAIGAGHAYKFASLLGKILSELAIDGQTAHDISLFNPGRPALCNPEYVRDYRY